MERVENIIANLVRDEEGASGVEYGLLIALIAAVIIGTVASLGTKLNTAFGKVEQQLP